MKTHDLLGITMMLSSIFSGAWATDYVDSTVQHLFIDSSQSSVTAVRESYIFDPNTDAPSLITESQILSIMGAFDARVTEYRLGCADTPFGSICQSVTQTIQLIDPAIEVNTGEEREFLFPTFSAYFTAPDFSGDSGPCSVTLPGSYCTGFSSGPLSSFEGTFDGIDLQVNGIDPDGDLFGGVDYHYIINASVHPVPVPSAILMLSVALGFLSFFKTRNNGGRLD